ncbi:hypothetical protein G6F56_006805 [Rhizopus delemar]|nr:hypothetical protein G6F56_006805 [Rhizopus delemar]
MNVFQVYGRIISLSNEKLIRIYSHTKKEEDYEKVIAIQCCKNLALKKQMEIIRWNMGAESRRQDEKKRLLYAKRKSRYEDIISLLEPPSKRRRIEEHTLKEKDSDDGASCQTILTALRINTDRYQCVHNRTAVGFSLDGIEEEIDKEISDQTNDYLQSTALQPSQDTKTTQP